MSAETLNELLSGLLGLLCILVLVVSLVQLYRAKKRPPQVEQARVALKAGRAMLIRTGRRDWRNKPQVPSTITTAITRLTTGSSHTQPNCR